MTDIVDRANKALEGVTLEPWVLDVLPYHDPNGDMWETDVEVCGNGRRIHGFDLGYGDDTDAEIKANARFIAAARELVPELVAEIKRLRGLLVNVRYLLGEHQGLGEAITLIDKEVKYD